MTGGAASWDGALIHQVVPLDQLLATVGRNPKLSKGPVADWARLPSIQGTVTWCTGLQHRSGLAQPYTHHDDGANWVSCIVIPCGRLQYHSHKFGSAGSMLGGWGKLKQSNLRVGNQAQSSLRQAL